MVMVLLVWAAAVYIFFNQWGESKSQRKSHPRKTFPSFSSPKLTDVVARPKNHFPPKLPNFSNLPSTRFPLRNEDKMVNLPERGPGAAGERLQRWGEAAKRCLLCGCCQDEGKNRLTRSGSSRTRPGGSIHEGLESSCKQTIAMPGYYTVHFVAKKEQRTKRYCFCCTVCSVARLK